MSGRISRWRTLAEDGTKSASRTLLPFADAAYAHAALLRKCSGLHATLPFISPKPPLIFFLRCQSDTALSLYRQVEPCHQRGRDRGLSERGAKRRAWHPCNCGRCPRQRHVGGSKFRSRPRHAPEQHPRLCTAFLPDQSGDARIGAKTRMAFFPYLDVKP